MKRTEKAFDCVRLMRTVRDALSKQMEGLSFEEQEKIIEDRLRARRERRAVLHVVEASYQRDYIIRLRFNDGAEGYVDLADELHGQMFEPLQDVDKFKTFKVDPELNTVVWENGADLAPEFLHSRLLVSSRPENQADNQ